MKNILLVDDDQNLSKSLANLFDPKKYCFEFLEDGTEVPNVVAKNGKLDLVMLDVNLPSMSGLDVLKQIKLVNENIPVIVISGFVSTENAIEAIREGAYEYLTKPFEIERLIETVNRACGLTTHQAEVSASTPSRLTGISIGEIIGKSPEVVEIAKLVGQLAKNDAPVLIVGEPGTGKELVARAIHRNSVRSSNPFVTVNCKSLPESLLESELLGHEKGAFTGAYFKRIGKIEQASNGTMFIDDIGQTTMLTQSKLLRILQDKKYERVGGSDNVDVNVRLIAASDVSLVEAMKEGSFRVDLFYRLKVASIYIPPLRERRGDIPLLADHFLARFSKEQSLNKKISKEAMQFLQTYHWPGNVQELENNIHTAVVMSRSNVLNSEDFPAFNEKGTRNGQKGNDAKHDYADSFKSIIDPVISKLVATSPGQIYQSLESAFERALISSCLKHFKGNQVKTSETLGISRNTLRDRISRYNLY
ncbi:MAG: sigma-54-dependent transcriptional regulator [Candidatus Zixiibacteriota bacterium]